MKAIHNYGIIFTVTIEVGNYMLKYNFESNSQRLKEVVNAADGWELYAKVQFWKQFTTNIEKPNKSNKLGIIC